MVKKFNKYQIFKRTAKSFFFWPEIGQIRGIVETSGINLNGIHFAIDNTT